jgi:GTP-binding protein
MFVDEAEITAHAGDGGNGCASFRREKFIPHGGPNGGDGGDGGSAYCVADESYNTLQHLTGRHHWRARRGGHGSGNKRHGKRGEDVLIPVPPGTIVRDAEHGSLLKDLTAHGQRVCVARGGRGGLGNLHFVSSTHQAPREWTAGEKGQIRRLKLELKLIAEVGLVGLPNAGKSTLLGRLSAARPKVAAYPFTTLAPSLGIVELPGHRRIIMADIPGLIAGAHHGAGLGDTFLRHVERTQVLAHLVDVCPAGGGDPVEDLAAINRELGEYSPALAAKPQVVVANKMDLTGAEEGLDRLRDAVNGEVVPISAATGRGLRELTERLWDALHPEDAP